MDFFEHQEQARQRTGWLMLLFVVAVVLIIALVYLAVVVALVFVDIGPERNGDPALVWWQPFTLLWTALGVLLVVTTGSLYKISQVRQGGQRIAQMLGGRPIQPDTSDANERQVLNVVEEMAIAAGTPVPPVYLMEEEDGINAFAAGFEPDDAVIGLTRGAVNELSRDELQGVIAHEFSHMLNSDMRTNIRLMGAIHGIIVLSILGLILMRLAFYGALTRGHHGAAHSRREGGGGGQAVLVMGGLGLALLAIGYVGALFGRMIRAAVSRQREYLADASAVQFTRHPEGIAGALKKIGGIESGSRIGHARAEEASHMFFGQAFESRLTTLFATHPPLQDRIKRIDPRFGPESTKTAGESKKRRRKGRGKQTAAAGTSGFATQPEGGGQPAGSTGAAGQPTEPEPEGEDAIARIGHPSDKHLKHAATLIRNLPQSLKDAAHEPFGARALVFAMVLDQEPKAREKQFDRLREHTDKQVYELTQQLAKTLDKLDPRGRLPLLDMAVPALREMSHNQYHTFRDNLQALIEADEKLELFEWMLQRTLKRFVGPAFEKRAKPHVRYYSLKPLAASCQHLLSMLAYISHDQQEAAKRAFAQGAAYLPLEGLNLEGPASVREFASLDQALTSLAEVSPREKRRVLHACAEVIATDKKVTVREGELLRLIADSLGCPMPPLLPGQPIGGNGR